MSKYHKKIMAKSEIKKLIKNVTCQESKLIAHDSCVICCNHIFNIKFNCCSNELCSCCLEKIIDKNKCPFCRSEINGIELI
jgi:hypothetical protein